MEFIQNIIKKIDSWQQTHRGAAFGYAVIKKYGDDQAGYQAALVTYYAFLSLFPLLLVLTTATELLPSGHGDLQKDIIHSVSTYFPVLGNQLSGHVGGIHKSGLALVIGLLLTFYGARGVADAFRNAVNHLWWTPRAERPGFPKAPLQSLMIIAVGGAGFILASIVAGAAAAAGHGFVFRAVSILLNMIILFFLFSFLLNISLPKRVSYKETRAAAIAAAIGLVILQSAGGYLLAKELKNLDALYSNFALALGLLFWLYLQSQVLLYAVEIAAVHYQEAWPRSIAGKPTDADKHAKRHMEHKA